MSMPTDIKCFECLHFIKSSMPEGPKDPTPPIWVHHCRAFPIGIPGEIVSWKTPHDEERGDQSGDFIFEKNPNLVEEE
jgi:hypothetical protein